MVAAKRVLRYLKGTPDLCVRYSKDFTLHGYSDASDSDDASNCRSVSGYLYFVHVCRRTNDVELEETTGYFTLVMRIGVYRTSTREQRSRVYVCFVERITVSPVFFCADVRGQHGSSGTTAFSSRTKYMYARYHFLRELVTSNKIIISHVKTTDPLADIFTNFLHYPKFKAILDKISNFAS